MEVVTFWVDEIRWFGSQGREEAPPARRGNNRAEQWIGDPRDSQCLEAVDGKHGSPGRDGENLDECENRALNDRLGYRSHHGCPTSGWKIVVDVEVLHSDNPGL